MAERRYAGKPGYSGRVYLDNVQGLREKDLAFRAAVFGAAAADAVIICSPAENRSENRLGASGFMEPGWGRGVAYCPMCSIMPLSRDLPLVLSQFPPQSLAIYPQHPGSKTLVALRFLERLLNLHSF
jgi:hypothetical protein